MMTKSEATTDHRLKFPLSSLIGKKKTELPTVGVTALLLFQAEAENGGRR